MRKVLLLSLMAVSLLTGCLARKEGVEPATGTAPERSEQVALPARGSSQPMPAPVIVQGGDEQSLRKFLGRALHYGGYPEAGATEILVGAFPAGWPEDIQLPEHTTIVGGVARPGQDQVELYLDSPQSPEEVLAYFRNELPGKGWELPETQARPGFQSAVAQGLTFCHERLKRMLWVNAFPSEEGMADVRLHLMPVEAFSSCMYAGGPGSEDRVGRLLPALIAPTGDIVQSGGMTSGGNEGEMTAGIRTTLSAKELRDFFAGQLQKAGWSLEGEGAGGPAAWSFWRIESEQDERWAGVLLVLEGPSSPNSRHAWFRIELLEE